MGKVKTFISQEKLRSDLAIDIHDLDSGMMQQASLYSYYGTQYAKAQLQADRLKSMLELTEARLDKEIRRELSESGTKKTEGAIAAEIKMDDRYIEANNSYLEAKMVASMAKTTSESFMQRRDMLIQIGKDQREDRKGELRITSAKNHTDSMKEAAMSRIRQDRS